MKDRFALMGKATIELSICYQQLSAKLNRELEPLGLNMTQMSVLSHFSHQPELKINLTSLAKALDFNQPVTTKAAKSLVERGYLHREKEENDARVTLLTVTRAGLDVLNKAYHHSIPLLSNTYTHHSDEDLAQLISALEKMKHALGK